MSLDEGHVKTVEKFFRECEYPFTGLENQYQQLQYIKANLDFIVCLFYLNMHIN